jgi:hypothetical protein
MTMTVSEPTGSPAVLSSEAELSAPLPRARADGSLGAEPMSEAERLLAAPASDRQALGRRLLWGFLGLTGLGAGPELALSLVGVGSSPERGPLGFVASGLGLPFAAALTVSLPLPGLLILLGMQGDRADPRACLHALSVAYYRLGLVALGLTPILLLYAMTGARDGVLVGATLGYFLAGGLALSLLLGDLQRCLPRARARSRLLLFGWGCFVCLLSLYFFFKLEPFA